MGKRKKKSSSAGSLDSLLDTMTNVVGILVIMLVVTQLSASDATKRIKNFVTEYTQEELDEILEEADALKLLLDQANIDLADAEKEKPAKKKTLQQKKSEIARLLKELEKLVTVKADPAVIQKLIEERKKQIAVIETKIKKEEEVIASLKSQLAKTPEQGPDPNAKIVNLPNPQQAPEGAQEIKFLCMNGRIIPLSPSMITSFQSRTLSKMKQVARTFQAADGMIDCGKLKQIFEKTKVQDRFYRVKIGSYKTRKDPYIILEPQKNSGEELERISRGSSAYRNAIRNLNPQKNWIRFYVWNDSFDVYLAARNIATQRGLAAGWLPRMGGKNYTFDITIDKEIKSQLVCHGYEPAPARPKKPVDPNAPKLPKDDVD